MIRDFDELLSAVIRAQRRGLPGTLHESLVAAAAALALGLWCQRVANPCARASAACRGGICTTSEGNRLCVGCLAVEPAPPPTFEVSYLDGGLCIMHSCPLAVDECSDPAHLRVFRGPELRDLER